MTEESKSAPTREQVEALTQGGAGEWVAGYRTAITDVLSLYDATPPAAAPEPTEAVNRAVSEALIQLRSRCHNHGSGEKCGGCRAADALTAALSAGRGK